MTDRYSSKLGERDRLVAGVLAVFSAAATLAAALKGPAWLTAVFASLTLLCALAGIVLKSRRTRAVKREALSATWHLAPTRLREVAAGELRYTLGVDTEAPESLELLGIATDRHPLYVPRRADARVRERIEAALREGAAALVVVSGPSKAGKSRTLLEAAGAVLGNAWLLSPKTPEALAELAEVEPSGIGSGPFVVWIDDIEEFAQPNGGLNTDVLRSLDGWKSDVIVLATQGGKGIELAGSGAKRFHEVVSDLLTRYPAIPLDPVLTVEELAAVEERFPPEAAKRIAAEGLGEFMIAAPRLLDRLRNGDSDEGRAVISAAIDCRRAGLLRPLGVDELEKAYVHHLVGAPGGERFRRGLEWAAQPLYTTVALLQRRKPSFDEYQPHDFLVDFRRRQGPAIEDATWDLVIEEFADEDELLRVGTVAYQNKQPARAERAWRRADAAGSAKGAIRLGSLLEERGETRAAEAAYVRAEERGEVHAAARLGMLFANAGELERAEAALRRADEGGAAQGACWLGWLLEWKVEDLDGAEEAYRRAEERGHWHGASQLGWLLDRRERPGAIAAFRRGDDHGDATGARGVGWLLAKAGDWDRAEAAYRRADERGDGAGARLHGYVLERRGELGLAKAAYARADTRGDWRGTAYLGFCHRRDGELERAESLLRRADEHGDGYGSRELGLLLWERGEIIAAEAPLRRAAENNEKEEALLTLGRLLLYRGEEEAAEAAFAELEAEGSPRGALQLAQILEGREDPDLVERAYERAENLARLADNRGNQPESTCALGRLLLRRGDLDGAEDAFERAADDNCLLAMNWLGWLLANERLDSLAALRAYHRADERGDPHAPCSIGIILRNRSPADALAAFMRSDSRGNAEGSFYLGEHLISSTADPDTPDRALAAYRRAQERAEMTGEESVAELAARAIEELQERYELGAS